MRRIRRPRLPNILFTIVFVALCVASYVQFDRAIQDVSARSIQLTAETSHGDMVRIVSNELYDSFEEILALYESQEDLEWTEFASSIEYISLDQNIRTLFSGSNVIKVKIFAGDGFTIFSTDPAQLGEDLGDSSEVIHSLRGRPASEYDFRESFRTLNGIVNNIHVVSSYHPLRDSGNTIRGVVEIYSDREEIFQLVRNQSVGHIAQFVILIALLLSAWAMMLIYSFSRTRSDDF
jgi:hypothetical protein